MSGRGSSPLGFVMLCHAALHRAGEVARYWADRECPVVIHVDSRTNDAEFEALKASVAGYWNIRFSKRFACEWGTWSLVAATQAASELMLQEFIDVRHVYLTSGACLPLRPVEELVGFLEDRPRTDFIESVTTEDVDWTVGGLAEERFELHFPFPWKRQRWLFDKSVALQRRYWVKRTLPEGLEPHMGSQWWCLTRQTLSAILQDPLRARFDRFFKSTWIPDESYFQTLVRRYSTDLDSRSLTLSHFDHQGKPHVLYDDHLSLLRRSECFVARKAWPGATKLYDTLLKDTSEPRPATPPTPHKIDGVFVSARDRRTRGRRGLYMAGRFPRNDWESGRTAAPYTLCHGFGQIFEDFDDWLARRTGLPIHGHLFAPEKVEFAGGLETYAGGLTDSASLRDYNPGQFLANLVWNTLGERQVFQFGPTDRQELVPFLAGDPNASFWVVSGAWALPLYHLNADFAVIRKAAAQLQRVETAYIDQLKSLSTRANVQLWTLAEFIAQPMEHLQALVDHIAGPSAPSLSEAPMMADLDGFAQFVQNLKNQGMNPHLVGNLDLLDPDLEQAVMHQVGAKPYLVR